MPPLELNQGQKGSQAQAPQGSQAQKGVPSPQSQKSPKPRAAHSFFSFDLDSLAIVQANV